MGKLALSLDFCIVGISSGRTSSVLGLLSFDSLRERSTMKAEVYKWVMNRLKEKKAES